RELEAINIRLASHLACRRLSEVRATLAERSCLFQSTFTPSAGLSRHVLTEERLLGELAAQQPGNLRDTIAHEIASMIATGQLEEGDRLLSERRLADMFGVSRVSVREALSILKHSGMVASDERSGTRAIVSLPEGELAQSLSDMASEGF